MASIVAAATAAAKEGEGVVRMDRGRWKTLPGDTVRYFAYGSNMLDKARRRHTRGARTAGHADHAPTCGACPCCPRR